MKDILVAEFKNTENKMFYAVIGVTSIVEEDEELVINTLDPSKSVRMNLDSIKDDDLQITIYYPTEDDYRKLYADEGLFKHGLQVIDGRPDEE